MSLIKKEKKEKIVKKLDLTRKVVQPDEPMSDLLKEACAVEREEKTNPYFNAKGLWNHVYGGVEAKLYNTYRLLALAFFIIVLQTLGLIYMGTQSKIKPVVVEMQNGTVLGVADVSSAPMGVMDKVVAQSMEQFITSWRTLTPDDDIEKRYMTETYAMTTGNATASIDNYFAQNNPSVLSTQFKVSVSINNVLKLSSHTYQVEWTEYKETLSGVPVSQSQFTAQLSYQASPNDVTDSIAAYNPFGLFITQISWAQNYQN